jgi:hypothetical protein
MLLGVAAALIYASIWRHLLPRQAAGFPAVVEDAPVADGETPVPESAT